MYLNTDRSVTRFVSYLTGIWARTGQCHFPVLSGGVSPPGFSGSRLRRYGDPVSELTPQHQQLRRVLAGSMESAADLAPKAQGLRRAARGASVPPQAGAHFQRQPGCVPSHECLELSPGLDFFFNREKQNTTKHPSEHTLV